MLPSLLKATSLLFCLFYTVTISASHLAERNPPPILSCDAVNEDYCAFSWTPAFQGAPCDYLVFVSNDPCELSPTSVAANFLESPAAQSTYLTQTSTLSIAIPPAQRYVRIVAQGEKTSLDVAALIDLQNFVGDSSTPLNGHAEEIFEKKLFNSNISADEWGLIAPYLIPQNHLFKPILDEIFATANPLSSLEELRKAGFETLVIRQGRGLIVAKHPRIKKYLFKLYLDTVPKSEWPLFVNRAKGARMVQDVIDTQRYESELKVPTKWIYALPRQERRKASGLQYPKTFVLLVEDMNLPDSKTSRQYYKTQTTRAQLRALFYTINTCGLSDSHIDNIPFSHDGKIAFIDTEYINVWPVHPEWITDHLGLRKQQLWKELMANQPAK